MIGLIITLATVGGGIIFAVIVGVFALVQTGRIALPNSPQRRVQQARVEAQIAELDLRRAEAEKKRAEARFQLAQLDANRQLMEAQTLEKLAEVHDRQFKRELEAPRKKEV